MRPLGAAGFIVLAAAGGWLAVANRHAAPFHFDALRPGAAASTFELPVYAILLIGAFIGVLIGSLYMLGAQGALKRRIREEQARAERLQRLLAEEALARDGAPAAPRAPVRRSLLSRIAG